MRATDLLAVLSGFLAVGSAQTQAETGLPEPEVGGTASLEVTGRYIVQFSESAAKRFRRQDKDSSTKEFYSKLKSLRVEAEPVKTFTSNVFYGASFQLSNSDESIVDAIQALPEVEKIWPASIMTVSPLDVTQGADTLQQWSPHRLTGVDKLHEQGRSGEGVIVAIVDTGIDYNHPALGGGFGKGFKVEGGYDIVGDDYVVNGPLNPDADPHDCLGHGTHVAGIIVANSTAVIGVAPGATLRAYKVFGCSDGTSEDNTLEGIIRAYEEGADVINLSLGSARGFPQGPLAIAANNIVQEGVLVVFAAGNSGEMGPYYTSSGANGKDVLAVGSVLNNELVGWQVVARASDNTTREIAYIDSLSRQWDLDGSFPAHFFPDTRNIDMCAWWADDGIPSTEIAVLPRTQDCSWQRHDSALFGSVKWVFYYNFPNTSLEVPDRVYYDSENQPKGFSLITYEDGDWIVSKHEQNLTVQFEFKAEHRPIGIENAEVGSGLLSTFTSWGPTLDNRLKPEISAPGGKIYSTWPLNLGTWASASGTSMASPYIAGVGALFFGSRGGRAALGANGQNPALIARNRIISSGKSIIFFDGNRNDPSQLASVAQGGAGLVDAVKALEYTTSLSTSVIHLNDTARFQGSHTIEISNSGKESVKYTIAHEPGLTILTYPAHDGFVSGFHPPALDGNQATTELSTTEVEVAAGGSASFSVTFIEPQGLDPVQLPVYGGKIQVIGSNGEAVSATYQGIVGDLKNAWIWNVDLGVPVFLSGYGGYIEDGHVYSFEDGTDVPTIYTNLLFSTREFSFDLVHKDWQPSDFVYPPVAGENNWYGPIRARPDSNGAVVDFPFPNYPRRLNAFYVYPSGTYSTGESIKNGEYKILARALKTFGDEKVGDDWQLRTSPWFQIQRSNATVTSAKRH